VGAGCVVGFCVSQVEVLGGCVVVLGLWDGLALDVACIARPFLDVEYFLLGYEAEELDLMLNERYHHASE